MARSRRDEIDEDDEDATPPARPDAWVGLIGISTAALAVAAVFLFLDADTVPDPAPAAPAVVGGDGLLLPAQAK